MQHWQFISTTKGNKRPCDADATTDYIGEYAMKWNERIDKMS